MKKTSSTKSAKAFTGKKAVKKKPAAAKSAKTAKSSRPAASASKKTTKKAASKKASAKKKAPAKKKAAAAKVTKKKAVAKKPAAKKPATKKKAAKSPAKKAATKKTSAKKTSPKTSTTKKPAANKTAAKKAAASTKTAHASAAKSSNPAAAKRKFTPPRVPYAALAAAPRPAYDPSAHEPLTDAQLRKVKTGLTAKDLRFFRQELLERRAEIIGDVQGLEAARSGNAGEISHMPLHMADVGSDNYEQEFTLGLMESERKTIIEIDEALQRIENKTYGVCVESGEFIGRPRLEAKPWAKYCIEVARERERRGR